MGHDFYYVKREGLPVHSPAEDGWDGADTPAWRAAWVRYWDATPEERGHWSCSYSWSAQLVQALTDTGVLIEVERAPRPAQVYTDDECEELTPEGRAYLSQGAGRPFRVAGFKLAGDPAILTPEECGWIGYALRPHPNPDMQAFGRFCEAAATHGGLMVG